MSVPLEAMTKARSASGTERWLVFELDGELCAVPAGVVQEILHLPSLNRPPQLPPIVAGFLNLGGVAVPVLRLDRLFGLRDVAFALYTPLVVVRGPGGPVAFVVEGVRDLWSVSRESTATVDGGRTFKGCVEAEALLDDEVVHLLAVEKLLLEEEAHRVAAFREREEERLRQLGEGTPG